MLGATATKTGTPSVNWKSSLCTMLIIPQQSSDFLGAGVHLERGSCAFVLRWVRLHLVHEAYGPLTRASCRMQTGDGCASARELRTSARHLGCRCGSELGRTKRRVAFLLQQVIRVFESLPRSGCPVSSAEEGLLQRRLGPVRTWPLPLDRRRPGPRRERVMRATDGLRRCNWWLRTVVRIGQARARRNLCRCKRASACTRRLMIGVGRVGHPPTELPCGDLLLQARGQSLLGDGFHLPDVAAAPPNRPSVISSIPPHAEGRRAGSLQVVDTARGAFDVPVADLLSQFHRVGLLALGLHGADVLSSRSGNFLGRPRRSTAWSLEVVRVCGPLNLSIGDLCPYCRHVLVPGVMPHCCNRAPAANALLRWAEPLKDARRTARIRPLARALRVAHGHLPTELHGVSILLIDANRPDVSSALTQDGLFPWEWVAGQRATRQRCIRVGLRLARRHLLLQESGVGFLGVGRQ
mmetsp:Transcript_111923/g.316291  ORF Transcript_111923/g.316291 Transcript_111923/m.316291 type:complete len:466 (-) Transcript_111923:559-1956(-)